MSERKYTPEDHDLCRITDPKKQQDEMDRRKKFFSDNGFQDEALPTKTPELIDAKLEGLKNLGFNPTRVIQSAPVLLDYSLEKISDKLSGLKERGFDDPQTLCLSFPTAMGLAFANIDAKLAWMKAQGFTDPVKMIECAPAILGYGLKNIDRRIKFFNRLIDLYSLPFSATELMGRQTGLFSVKMDRLVILARVIKEYQVPLVEITEKLISKLVYSNIENVLMAMEHAKPGSASINDLIKEINLVKKQAIPKEDKRSLIAENTDLDPKISRRYFRGYPDKNPQPKETPAQIDNPLNP